MYQLVKVTGRKTRNQFINMAWDIYKGDDNWVPPLRFDQKAALKGRENPLIKSGPNIQYILKDDKKVIGRLMAGVDFKLLEEKDFKRGYLSLFECIDDQKAADMLFDAGVKFVKSHGMDEIYGPVSPTNGEESRGVLVKGFEGKPALLSAYNPRYYLKLYENYGFTKAEDQLAFKIAVSTFPMERFEKIVNYSMKKFDFRVDSLAISKIKSEMRDVIDVMHGSRDDTWDNFRIQRYDELCDEFNNLKPFIDKNLIYIARLNKTDQPIGFIIAIPDYNDIIKKMNGRLLSLGLFSFLFGRKKIKKVKAIAQYVIPKYEGWGINGALHYYMTKAAIARGITSGDASTVSELNYRSIKSAQSAGGEIYRIYRYYSKAI